MNITIITRGIYFFCFLICVISLAASAYLQYVVGLEPCSMCIIQRWCIIALTVWLIIALVHRTQRKGQIIYGFGVLLFSGLGAFTAARQVWLQHLPKELQPECGPGFNYLMENFPLTEALSYMFAGDGNCAVVDWTFLGQSLATWSLVLFIFFVVMGLIAVGRAK